MRTRRKERSNTTTKEKSNGFLITVAKSFRVFKIALSHIDKNYRRFTYLQVIFSRYR